MISTLSNLIAELSFRTKWHTTCCTLLALNVLHVNCALATGAYVLETVRGAVRKF